MLSFLIGFIAALALYATYGALTSTIGGAAIEAAIDTNFDGSCASLGGSYCTIDQQCVTSSGESGTLTQANDLTEGTICCIGNCVSQNEIAFIPPEGLFDLNGDGVVDGNDLNIVKQNFGNQQPNPIADVNHDGMVDIVDVSTVARAMQI